MPKKGKKVKQKQRQSQKQIVNINLGKVTKPKKRGKRKTQITKPVITNYQLPPPPLYNITYQQPSLIPPPVAPVARSSAVAESLIPAPLIEPREVRGLSLPVRAGLAVGSGIGSAIVSSGSAVLSSIFWPPDIERPAVAPVVPFPVREEPPAFANIEPVFAEPPFPLVPYQAPLPPPEDEFFDLPEDPFNLEQPPEDVFNVAPAAPAAAPAVEEEEPEYLPYDATQFEDLRRLTAQYTAAEQPNLLLESPINEPFSASVVELNDPFSAPVIEPAKPQKKKFPTKPSTDDTPELTVAQIRAKIKREEEAAAKREAKRREKGKDVRGLFPVEAQPVILGEPVFEESQKEQPAFGLEVIQRATPDKQKGGLERVRTEQPEEPLQYGFSN